MAPPPVVRQAIIAGEIDIYPGIPAMPPSSSKRPGDPAWKDAAKAYELAKTLDFDANKVVWLTPSPANNTWAIALRKDVAEPNKLTTLTDFDRSRAVARLCWRRPRNSSIPPQPLPAFRRPTASLKPEQLITLSGGDTAATIAAAANQTNGANAAIPGLDGGIAPSGLVVLEDDKGVQPVYQPAPIIREALLKANPQIEEILKPVFEKLDLVTLQDLNGRVSRSAASHTAKAVAEDFLKKNGFIK